MSQPNQMNADAKPRDKRILEHIHNIYNSAHDPELYAKALQKVCSDANLTAHRKKAIYKTLAQDAAQAYLIAVTGRPINIDPILEAAMPPEEFKKLQERKQKLPPGVEPFEPWVYADEET